MFIWCKDSAAQVMTDTRPLETDCAVLTLRGARAMTVCGQILLRDHADFALLDVRAASLRKVEAEWITFERQEYALFNDGIPYPDPLSPEADAPVRAASTLAIWVSVRIPADAPAGPAAFDVVCRTSAGDFTARVLLHISAVTLPEPAAAAFDHEYFFDAYSLTEYGNAFALFSPEWEALMGEYAGAMKELRVNCLHIAPQPLLAELSRRTGKADWAFDFSRFDSFIEIFLRRGSFRRIVLGHPLDALTGAHIQAFDADGNPCLYETRSAEGEAFAAAWLTALQRHFSEKGWLPMLLLHLADEPHETENWRWFRALVRRLMPGVPCGEPLDLYASSRALEGQCDVFIPRFDVYEEGKAFFDSRRAAGDTVWSYSCCFPEEPRWLNRFIDEPHRWPRLIPWACYANGLTGYLHWGFNYWNASPELYGRAPGARFKGDSFVVWPDAARRSVRLSTRALGSRAGIQEYELLRLAAKKHPEAAMALARTAARSFTDFSRSETVFERLAPRLFALCEDAVSEDR